MKTKLKIVVGFFLTFILFFIFTVFNYDKYDTKTLLSQQEKLDKSQTIELARKTLIVCANKFDKTKSNAINIEQTDNIYTLTYDSSFSAKLAYAKYSNDSDIVYCEYDTALETSDVKESNDIRDAMIGSHINDTNKNLFENINIEENSNTINRDKAMIAVIDSGATGEYKHSYNAFNDTTDVTDTVGHGTKMIKIIENELKGYNYEIVPIKVANDNGYATVSTLIKALNYVSKLNSTVVNISLTSTNTKSAQILNEYITKLGFNGTAVIVSAGNNSDNVENYTPANIEDAIVVGSCDGSGTIKDFSNRGNTIDYLVTSDSTSEAAAITSGLYVKAFLDNEDTLEMLKKSKKVFTYDKTSFDELQKNPVDFNDDRLWWCAGTFSDSGPLGGVGTSFTLSSGSVAIYNKVYSGGTRTSEIWPKGANVKIIKHKVDKYAYFNCTTNGKKFVALSCVSNGGTYNGSYGWFEVSEVKTSSTPPATTTSKVHMVTFDPQGGTLPKSSVESNSDHIIIPNGDYFIRSAVGTQTRYIHAGWNGTKNYGPKVVIFNNHSTTAQQTVWTFERYNNTEYYYIYNRLSGKALKAYDQNTTTSLQLENQYIQGWFLWKIVDEGDGKIAIINRDTGRALNVDHSTDTNDTQVLSWSYVKGSANEQWYLENINEDDYPTRKKEYGTTFYVNSNNPVKEGYTFGGWTTTPNVDLSKLYKKIDVNGSYIKYFRLQPLNGGNMYELLVYAPGAAKVEAPTWTGNTTAEQDDIVWHNLGTNNGNGWDRDGVHYNFGTQIPWHTTNNNGTDIDSITNYTIHLYAKNASGATLHSISATYYLSTNSSGLLGPTFFAEWNYPKDQNTNVTLYANWIPNTYTLTINPNGGYRASDKNTVTVTKNKQYLTTEEISERKRDNYILTGYTMKNSLTGSTTDLGGATLTFDDSTKVGTFRQGSVPITLTAQWIPNTYTVTYNANGGIGSMSNQSISYDTSTTLTANEFSKTGYTFKGWNTKADGSGTAYADKASVKNLTVTNNATVILYAQWTINSYTNTIDHWAWGFKNGEGNNEYSNEINKNRAFKLCQTSFTSKYNQTTILDNNLAVKIQNGFKLSFIWTNLNGIGTKFNLPYSYKQEANSRNFQYTYHPIDYNITYNLNSGKNDKNNPSSYNVLYGVSINNPTKEGYTFDGWQCNQSVILNRDIIDKYNTEYKTNGNKTDFSFTNNISDNKLKEFQVQLFKNAENTTKINYIGLIDSVGSIGIHNTTYVHNQDSDNYIIRVKANGTTKDSDIKLKNVYLIKGHEYKLIYNITKATSDNVEVSNFEFVDTTPITNINEGCNATFTDANDLYTQLAKRQIGDVTLTARWTANKYTVHFDKNSDEATGSMSDQTFTYDKDEKLSANKFARTGYSFAGWNTKADGSGTSYKDQEEVKNLTTNNGNSITLYAQWSVNSYTNTINHWAWGFKNGEGNNPGKEALKFDDTKFTKNYNDKFIVDKKLAVKIPNGFYLKETFGTKYIDSNNKWNRYPLGTKVTQKDLNMGFEYDYIPIDYNITYNLNGGKNNKDNPSNYNVLYGITLYNPTKEGYTFAGWDDQNGNKVTGINKGCNATFTSASDLYSQLAKRQIGDIELTARWTANEYTVHFEGNGATSGSMENQTFTYDKTATLHTNTFTKT